MILKGYRIHGCLVIEECEEKAIEMYIEKTGRKTYSDLVVEDLDEFFYYFNIKDISEEDYANIYDRKYPYNTYDSDGTKTELVSLKRPFAKKYIDVIGDKKELLNMYY